MCEEGNQRNVNIPENADVIIFAEDLVNHVMLQYDLPCWYSGIADYRSLVENAFSDSMRVVMNSLRKRQYEENKYGFEVTYIKEQKFDRDAFMARVTKLRSSFPSAGLNERQFFQYSQMIASLGARCSSYGFVFGPELAVEVIKSLLEECKFGWDSLNNTAEILAQQYAESDASYPTPDTSPESTFGSSLESENEDDDDDYKPPRYSLPIRCEIPSASSSDEMNSNDRFRKGKRFRKSIRRRRKRGIKTKRDDSRSERQPAPSDDGNSNSSVPLSSEESTLSNDDEELQTIQEEPEEELKKVYFSDTEVREEIVTSTQPSNQLRLQHTRKRRISSSSSASEFHLSDSAQQPRTSTPPRDCTANADINTWVSEEESKAGPSIVTMSPIRKPTSETRSIDFPTKD